jgi:hypothetical protein
MRTVQEDVTGAASNDGEQAAPVPHLLEALGKQ